MADQRLTDLTEFAATLALDDWAYLVDKSDTSQHADGSAYKIQIKNLVGRVLLQTITNSSAGEFDFGPALTGGIIPTGFNRLIIMGTLRSNASVVSDGVYVIFNADTTVANYHSQNLSAIDGVTTGSLGEASDPSISTAAGASAPGDSYTNVHIILEDYAGTRLKGARSAYDTYSANDSLRVGVRAVISAITDQISRVRIRTDNHATDQLFGTLRLYGEI